MVIRFTLSDRAVYSGVVTVKHLVLIKVRSDVAEAEVAAAFRSLEALVGEVPGLLSFSAGQNHSPEAAGQAYTHAFVMEFEDEASRDAYLPDPRHQKAAQGLRSIREAHDAVTIVDFTAS
jgi:quinol monooxygenase YgiN